MANSIKSGQFHSRLWNWPGFRWIGLLSDMLDVTQIQTELRSRSCYYIYAGFFFRHLAKNSGRTKTQVFDKTQVFFKKLRSQKRKMIPQPQKLWRSQAFYVLGVWKISETQVDFRETQVSFRKTQVWNFEKHTSTANWYLQGRRKSVEKKSLVYVIT